MASRQLSSQSSRHSSHGAARAYQGGISHLWQVPLFLISLGLFAYAAYLFIDPHAGPTIDAKIDVARKLLKDERPEAAVNQLNNILTAQKMDHPHEAVVHALMAQAVDDLQKFKHINIKTYHEQVIEQTALAIALGAKPTFESERRLGENYEALKQPTVALEHYRKAMGMDPSHALRLQRKVIDLQLLEHDEAGALATLNTYQQAPELAEGERAWALCNQAKLLVDQKEFIKARSLLDRASKLDADPATQGQVHYYLGYCAYKLGDVPNAERMLRVARQQLKTESPLDADAAYLLGKLFQDRSDPQTAISFFQEVLVSHPESRGRIAPISNPM